MRGVVSRRIVVGERHISVKDDIEFPSALGDGVDISIPALGQFMSHL